MHWEPGTSDMVYYFNSTAVSPSAFVYVGKDKFESMQAASPSGQPADRLTTANR